MCTYEPPPGGTPEPPEVLLGGTSLLRLRKGNRTLAEIHPPTMPLLFTLMQQNFRGLLTVPHDPDDCDQVRQRFLDWLPSATWPSPQSSNSRPRMRTCNRPSGRQSSP